VEERVHLREKLQQLMPPDEKGGFIIRTMAEAASDRELASDVEYLRKLWHDIREQARTAAPLAPLYQDLNLSMRVLRDFAHEDTGRIYVDSNETHQAMCHFARQFTPNVVPRLAHYQGERPLFDLHNVEDDIERALARRVDLKSGGYLIIDQTEALTTVDVNTGGFVGGRTFDDTIFKTNLEAAGAIARQLRLRNLGGIVVADFIDMLTQDHQQAVLFEFRKHLQRDRVKTMVSGFSQLGLVEMTRKRTRESLAHLLCEPCPACGGKGSVKTARTVAYDILREILREARQFNPMEFRVVASTPVIDLLLDDESSHLAGLSDFIGKPISLQSEPSMGPEQYDIVLL
jgi:ribonuclease G